MARRESLGYSAIRTEGAILPPSLLARVQQGDGKLEGLKPEDYGLSGERLREAASRAWNALQAAWASFSAQREKLPTGDVGTSLTRNRWLYPVLRALDYGALDLQRDFPTSHLYGHVPIHTVGFTVGLDERTKGKTPHGLVQTLLNGSEDHLWGIVTNGLRWRLLRDSASLSRQAMVEFDLEAIFTGQLYDEFLLFWLVCHQSRVKSETPEACWLEKWSKAAGEEGKRALDTLRDGVQAAIEALGQGYLRHPLNTALREKVRSGALDKQDYYRQLLRQVYRLLFLFVAEDRGLLFAPDAPESVKQTFSQYYGTQRLRRLAERLRGSNWHYDLFRQYRLLTGKLGEPGGCPELGLTALGGFLFAPHTCPDLDSADLANPDFLLAIRKLAVTQEGGRQTRVDYKNLGSEEFGSVYESLLELHPELRSDGTAFSLLSASGNERKTTGSYYTPDSLIQVLLDEALEPVVDAAVKQDNPEQAILNLKVVDPAAGSGHFLIAAAHRLARRLAQVRTGDDEPSVEATRKALRDVIGRCLYAVDLNPMAVELCKVALWMEALEPGKPLSFLDHHIQCGNALLGTTPALMKQGIPDAAFKAIEGDDPAVCTEFKRKNKAARDGQLTLAIEDAPPWERQGELATAMLSIATVDDASVAGVTERASRWESLVTSAAYENNRLLADTWCAAFVWKKQRSDTAPPYYPITQEHFAAIRKSPHGVEPWIKDEVRRLAKQYQFFHWHLAFPDVFGAEGEGGFDVVLGNPPWERVKLQEKEWFATRRPEIANAANASKRRAMIENLKTDDPALYTAFLEDRRKAEGESQLLRHTDRFPLCGRGDVNTYAVFAEMNRELLNQFGRAGFIIQSDIATGDTYKDFFSSLLKNEQLVKFYDFVNTEGLFPNIHRTHPHFCLIVVAGGPTKKPSDFSFWNTNTSHLSDKNRHFELTSEEIELLNPNTKTCPVFHTKKDSRITISIYRNTSVLRNEAGSDSSLDWKIDFLKKMLDFTIHRSIVGEQRELGQIRMTESGEDVSTALCSPVYEAKMIHQFDHRFASYPEIIDEMSDCESTPISAKENIEYSASGRYWVKNSDFSSRIAERQVNFRGILSIRGITNTTNERTVISAIRPISPAFNSIGNAFTHSAIDALLICGCLNSFVADYVARQKMGGPNLDPFIVFQLAVVSPVCMQLTCSWNRPLATNATWIAPRVLELTYTAYDMTPFARDCGYDGEPFIWNDERRFQLRCELDAAYFHLYGINRDDLDYIMGTFPIVKRKDEAAHGTYRTRDRILEIYDQMAAGHFVSPLDPPPAHGWVPPASPHGTSPHGDSAVTPSGSRSSLAAKGGGSDDASATPNPLREAGEGRRLSGGERLGGETEPTPDLGATDDTSADQLGFTLPIGRVRVNGQDAELLEKKALGGGRVQYRVILDATGEIKNFVSPPAQVEEG